MVKPKRIIDSNSSDEETLSSSKSKATQSKKPRTSGASTTDKLAVDKTDEGDEFITLGKDLRRVVVREFKGKTLIDIRDFYTDRKSGEVKPGKGISLSPEQWELLKANMDVVDAMVKEKK